MTINKYFEEYAVRGSGAFGCATECAVREYLSGRKTAVKAQGKIDASVTTSGKRVTLEVKTACAQIDNAERAQFVAYWAEPELDVEVEHSVVVFTREQWHEFLNGYTGRGSLTRTDAKRGKTHIQSFRGLYTGVRPTASLPIAEYIYSVVETMPTLAEWKQAVRGK
jgi:hypothetical protein